MSESISAANLAALWSVIKFHADNENIEKTRAYKHHVHSAPRNLLAAALMKKEVDELILSIEFNTLNKSVEYLGSKKKKRSKEHRADTARPSIRHITWSDLVTLGPKFSSAKRDKESTVQKVEGTLWEMRASVEDSSLLQEAAWNWIGGHLEDYNGRFEKNLRDQDMDKMAIWNELVSIREKCKALEEQIPQLETQLENCLANLKSKKGILKR